MSFRKIRSLTYKEEIRIKKCIQQKIMNFSPTISPAPKDLETKEIESIKQAILYYQNNDVEKAIIQIKHMGSYCDVYLAKNIEETRFFSRSGYPLPEFLDKKVLFQALVPLHQKLNWDGIKLYIIQTELMPWSVLGDKLIQREFRGYQNCHQSHLNYLKDSSLLDKISALYSAEYFEFCKDETEMSNDELRIKYPDHFIKQYSALRNIKLPEVRQYQSSIDLYRRQVDIYSQKSEIQFKPFNILKIIYLDDTEELADSNIENYRIVSEEESYVIDYSKELSEQIKQAYDFYHTLINKNHEGVVIKPDKIWNKFAPMLKVRNNNYLQMIYGVEFRDKFQYYLERRNIRNKINCSINEWKITQAILKIPMSEINEDNTNYTDLIRMRIMEEDFESKIDFRL